jgi:hypothetical protein
LDSIIEVGDQIIAISEDDDTVRLSGLAKPSIEVSAIQSPQLSPAVPERMLILGWNRRGREIIRQLDNFLPQGSETTVVADVSEAARTVTALKHTNQSLVFREGDTTDREALDGLNIPDYQHVIVLSASDTLNASEADARTLVTLLHLRDISERTNSTFTIVSEMLDVRDRDLAEVTRADDFIVSNQLVSLMLAQVSENRHLSAVFASLFDPEGSEIYLKPIEDYVQTGVQLNFYTLLEAAKRRGETAIGYRRREFSRSPEKAYGVVLNPDKSKSINFATGDKIIVLAEN